MTRAAVILCSLLALAGCDEETIENLVEGKVEVFTIGSVNIDGDWENSNLNLAENVPIGTYDDLVNVAGSVEYTGCAKIPNTAGMCFKEGDSTSCLPSNVNELGLKTYKVDVDNLKAAIDVGFVPTVAQYLTEHKFNVNLTIEDAECSSVGLE